MPFRKFASETTARYKPPEQGRGLRCVICGSKTRRGKSYCIDHIEQAPRIQWVLKQLAAQESELQEVATTQSTLPIKEDSLTVKEIVNNLHHKGPKTLRGLAKELSVELGIISVYVRYMKQMAIVSIHTNKRKSDQIVQLEVYPDERLNMPVY